MEQHTNSNGTSCETPRSLISKLFLLAFILKDDVGHLGEILTQIVRCGTLNCSSILWNHCLNCCSVVATWKLLQLTLLAFYHWNCEYFFISTLVELKNVQSLCIGLLLGGMGSVTFLPQEFSCSDEWSWMLELPSDDVCPLIKFDWQVSVTLNPLSIGWIHDSFRGWSDGNWFSQIRLSALGDPSDFRGKACDMFLFCFQCLLGHKDWEISIFDIFCLEQVIKKFLQNLPNEIAPWSQDVASTDIVVFQHF